MIDTENKTRFDQEFKEFSEEIKKIETSTSDEKTITSSDTKLENLGEFDSELRNLGEIASTVATLLKTKQPKLSEKLAALYGLVMLGNLADEVLNQCGREHLIAYDKFSMERKSQDKDSDVWKPLLEKRANLNKLEKEGFGISEFWFALEALKELRNCLCDNFELMTREELEKVVEVFKDISILKRFKEDPQTSFSKKILGAVGYFYKANKNIKKKTISHHDRLLLIKRWAEEIQKIYQEDKEVTPITLSAISLLFILIGTCARKIINTDNQNIKKIVGNEIKNLSMLEKIRDHYAHIYNVFSDPNKAKGMVVNFLDNDFPNIFENLKSVIHNISSSTLVNPVLLLETLPFTQVDQIEIIGATPVHDSSQPIYATSSSALTSMTTVPGPQEKPSLTNRNEINTTDSQKLIVSEQKKSGTEKRPSEPMPRPAAKAKTSPAISGNKAAQFAFFKKQTTLTNPLNSGNTSNSSNSSSSNSSTIAPSVQTNTNVSSVSQGHSPKKGAS